MSIDTTGLDYQNIYYTLLRFHHACGCCAPGYTDTCFLFLFFLVTLMDAMHSSDVSASHDRARLLVRSSLRLTSRLLYSYESYRLAQTLLCHAYVSRLCFLLFSGCVDLSFSRTSLRPSVYRTTRLPPVPVLLMPSLLSVVLHLPDWTIFLPCTFTVLTPACTCIHQWYIQQ